jgi:hypothetical protein
MAAPVVCPYCSRQVNGALGLRHHIFRAHLPKRERRKRIDGSSEKPEAGNKEEHNVT